MPRPGISPRAAVRSHCTNPPCILGGASSQMCSGPRCSTTCTQLLLSQGDGRCLGGSQQLGHKALPLLGTAVGFITPPSRPPHLVPRKPPHLQQLCLLGGVKSPAELRKRPRLFCAPAVPSCALGMHCSTSWMPKLTEAKEAEEPVSKTLGVPGVLAPSTDHQGAGCPVATTSTCARAPRSGHRRALHHAALWTTPCHRKSAQWLCCSSG